MKFASEEWGRRQKGWKGKERNVKTISFWESQWNFFPWELLSPVGGGGKRERGKGKES